MKDGILNKKFGLAFAVVSSAFIGGLLYDMGVNTGIYHGFCKAITECSKKEESQENSEK